METMTNLRPSRTLHGLLLRPRSSQVVWPNPQDSVGALIGTIGRQNCWEAIGPVRNMFVSLSKDIKQYLDENTEAISYWITWSIYMIGKHSRKSVPTIIFCCENEAHRKAVRDKVRESGIMDLHPPGIALKHLPRAPDYKQLVQLASRLTSKDFLMLDAAEAKEQYPFSGRPGKFATGSSIPERPIHAGQAGSMTNAGMKGMDHIFDLSPKVYCFRARPRQGDTLYIDIGPLHALRRATAGNTINIYDRTLLMTAAHVFSHGDVNSSAAPPDDSTLHFSDSDDDSDLMTLASNDSEEWTWNPTRTSVEAASIHAPARVAIDIQSAKGKEKSNFESALTPSELPDLDTKQILEDAYCVGWLLFSSEEIQNNTLDYALVFLIESSPDLKPGLSYDFPPYLPEASIRHDDCPLSIEVFTASLGGITGTVSWTPLFLRLPGSCQYQEVYLVHLPAPLTTGDCGSRVQIFGGQPWAVGYIIAGSPDASTALFVPAFLVFDDIKRNSGEIQHRLESTQRTNATDVDNDKTKAGISRLVLWKEEYARRLRREALAQNRRSDFVPPSKRPRKGEALLSALETSGPRVHGELSPIIRGKFHEYDSENEAQELAKPKSKERGRSKFFESLVDSRARLRSGVVTTQTTAPGKRITRFEYGKLSNVAPERGRSHSRQQPSSKDRHRPRSMSLSRERSRSTSRPRTREVEEYNSIGGQGGWYRTPGGFWFWIPDRSRVDTSRDNKGVSGSQEVFPEPNAKHTETSLNKFPFGSRREL